MKKVFSTMLILMLLGCCLNIGVPETSAANSHNITLTATVDPEAELAAGGNLSWIRFDINNGGTSEYSLNNAYISCSDLSLNQSLDSLITISSSTSREFYLNDITIPDSVLDRAITFVLSWTDISYDAMDIYQQNPISTTQTAEVSVTIERFVEPIILVSSSCNTELAKPNDIIEITYTLENQTRFDMYNLVLYDSQITDSPITLPGTTLIAGATMRVTLPVSMASEDIISQPIVTYTVRNSPVQTQSALPITIVAAIIELEMSVQSFPATLAGTEFSITVSNTGTQPITGIQLYDEINTPIDSPFDLQPQQSKSISYIVSAAASATQTRYISFHAEGTDCFEEPYIYYDTTSYPIIPYVDSSQVSIALSATLSIPDPTNLESATVSFEIRNDSSVLITNATLSELYYFTEQPIASFAILSSGVTAFSYDFTLDTSMTSLAFVLNGYDPSGAPCTTQTVVIDLTEAFSDTTTPVTPSLDGATTIGGTVNTSGIARVIRIALTVICIIVAVGIVAVFILYFFELKFRTSIPVNIETQTTGKITIEETDSINTHSIEPIHSDEDEESEDTVPPFDTFGYVAPTKLRYFSLEPEENTIQERLTIETPTTPIVSISTVEAPAKCNSVRVVSQKYQKKARPLSWNEFIKVGFTS